MTTPSPNIATLVERYKAITAEGINDLSYPHGTKLLAKDIRAMVAALLASDALIRRAGEVLKPLAKFWRDLEASDPKSWEHVIDAFAARYRADAGLRDAFDRVTAIAADLDKKRKE